MSYSALELQEMAFAANVGREKSPTKQQQRDRNRIGWASLLSPFGVSLLSRLGVDVVNLPTDKNPITEALKREGFDTFVQRFGNMKGFSRAAVSRLATICQMTVYDKSRGPEGDGQPKGLRRQWYAWFKMQLAQPLAEQMGDLDENDQMNDLNWNARMSTTYAGIVDEGQVTYRDLWVEDASRMMEAIWEHLFRGCHIIVAVEKDSLYGDFTGPARALGAASVYSGKGKSSKAGIEKLLREHFGWSKTHDPFSRDAPLIVLHVSDHDFDGEAVIGPTFAQQARRYTPCILEARVGIRPEQIEQADWPDKWYRVKVGNTGYIGWAERKALFMAECSGCDYKWPVQGVFGVRWLGGGGHECPSCDTVTQLAVKVGSDIHDQPYGLEVEAMTSRSYRRLLVQALLEVLPFDVIIKKLREECVASDQRAAEEIAEEIYAANERYQELLDFLKRYDEVISIKENFEAEVLRVLTNLGSPHVSDWQNEQDDPLSEEYEDHVDKSGYGPWRPFSAGLRTRKLIEYLKEKFADRIARLEQQHIGF